MIVMLISDGSRDERLQLVRKARDKAAVYTEEYWQWLQCGSLEELQKYMDGNTHVDLFCLDITMAGVLDCLKVLRQQAPESYMILIADMHISPLAYMKPSIRAESLMLKPLTVQQIETTMDEAVRLYARKFSSDEQEQMFVLESRGSRRLMEYQKIFYFEAREKRVFLNTGSEEYGFNDTLDHLSEQLGTGFLRVHRSFLVNKEKIREVYLSQNRLVLDEEVEVPLSRSYKADIRAYLAGRNGKNGNDRKELDPVF